MALSGIGTDTIRGLAIDAVNNRFYVAASSGSLYSLDGLGNTTPSGAATLRGSIPNAADLASCGVVPDTPTLTKTFSPNPLQAPATTSTLTITIGNTNLAPYYLYSDLVDNVPSGMTVTASTLGGTCKTSANTLTATTTAITLAKGATIPVGGCTITATATVASTAGSYTNTIAASSLQTSVGTLTSTTSGTLVSNTAPTIAKAFSPASVALGATTTLTFTVTNPNPSTNPALTALNFTDTLTGMSVASTTLGGTCASVTSNPALTVGATALNLTIPSLAASANCTITVQVKGTQIGVNPNTTSGVTSAQTPTPGAASNTANLTVTPLAPTVGKSFAPASVLQGTATQLTITVTNPNAAAATSFTLTDDIAGTTGVTGLTITAVSSDTCKGSGTVTTASGKYVLTGGTLPAAGCSIVLTVQVPSSAAVGSKTNTIVGSTVAGSINNQSWPTPANATASLTVVAAADLTVTKTGPTYAKPGTDVTYTITVRNNSTANSASSVTVTDTLPATMTFKTSSPAATASGQTLNWGAVPLAANGTLTYTVTVTLPDAAALEATPAARSLTNTVSASSANDLDTTNNAASATTNMVYSKLTKTVRNVTRNAAVGTGGSGSPGEVLEYCIAFGNYGGITLANYTVSDGVPPNTTYVTGSAGVTPAVTFPGITPSFNGAATTWNDGTTTRAVNGVVTANVGSLTSGTQGQMCFRATIR